LTNEERLSREKILTVVSVLYGEGYIDGMERVIAQYDLHEFGPAAGEQMSRALDRRLELVDKAVENAKGQLDRRIAELVDKGLPQNIIMTEAVRAADEIAETKAELIREMEFGTARLEGAKAVVDESGRDYLLRFPHFDLNAGEKEECPICTAIRQGAPYTPAQAEALGYPSLPHPGCDHGWVIVLGEKELTRTEAHPPRISA
jgi:hypothetical protein